MGLAVIRYSLGTGSMNSHRSNNASWRADHDHGFTIIELLVASMVFSVVLLVVTAGVLQVTRVYYKGLTEANTQNTARSIMDTIAQTIQFTGGTVTSTASPVPGTDQAFCIGNNQFSYRLGWQVEDTYDVSKNQVWHGLVQANVAGCTSGTAAQILSNQTVTGRDLLGPHMRLANLVVEPNGTVPNQYKIQVRVVYGDKDILDNSTAANASCQNVLAGTQFCAVSDLSTIVVKRVK